MDTSTNDSKKEYNIKQIIKYGNITSIVKWEDDSVTEINTNELSDYSKNIYIEISNFNNSLNTFITNKSACIYMRISSSKNETSIDNQKQNCLNYLKEHNIPLQYIASDIGVSGRHMKNLNKELGTFSNYLDSTNILVLNSVDRLSRDCTKGMVFLERMCNKGIEVVFLKEKIVFNKDINSIDKQRIQTILSNAEFYSNSDSEKIKQINILRKQKGNFMGSIAPYGYKVFKSNNIRKLKSNRLEQNHISIIIKLYKLHMSHKKKKKEIFNLILINLKQKKIKKRNYDFTYNSIKNIIEKKIKDMDNSEMNNIELNLNNFNI